MRFRWNRTHPVAPSSEKIRTSTKKQHPRFPVPALHLALRCDKRSRHAFHIAGHLPAPAVHTSSKVHTARQDKSIKHLLRTHIGKTPEHPLQPLPKRRLLRGRPPQPSYDSDRKGSGLRCVRPDPIQSSAPQRRTSDCGFGKLQLQPCGRTFVELFQTGEIGGPVDERMLVGRLQAADGINFVRKSRGEGMRREVHLDIQ